MNTLLEMDNKKYRNIKKLAIAQIVAFITLLLVGIILWINKGRPELISDWVKLVLLIILSVSTIVDSVITIFYGDIAIMFLLKEYKKYRLYTDDRKIFIEMCNKGACYEVKSIYKYIETKEYGHKCFIIKALLVSKDDESDMYTNYIEIIDIYTEDSKDKLKQILKNYYKVDA